ncbi:MAG: thioredoxin domain-containing protein, partial [Acidobacteriota bacterium]|nr:thioredoxin domain-containing protein [Acidobacteriota bacterium]
MTERFTARWVSLLLGATLLIAAIGCGDTTGTDAGKDSASAAAGDGQIVASWGDTTITMADLDKAAMAGENGDVYVKLFEARQNTLNAMIADKLTALEAEEFGKTQKELVEENVTNVVPRPTPEEIQAFFDQNKAQINGEFAQVSPQIERYLFTQNRAGLLKSYREGLEAKYGVTTSLEPVRFDVTIAANDPRKGPDSAPVKVVEWSDFQCPFCSRVGPAIEQVIATYGDQVQVVFRDYPLPANMHPEAQISAEAGQCAHEQDRFWDLHDKMFENQRALTSEQLKGYAAELALDTAAFDECLDSGRHRETVLADHR